jgi:hypothetical protein
MRYLLLALLLASCGGGGGGSQGPAPGDAPYRPGIHYGYYGTLDNQVAETNDHVSLYLESCWDGEAAAFARIKQHGKPTLLEVGRFLYFHEQARRRPDAETELRVFLDRVKAAGVIGQVIGIYPQDEPDGWGISAQDVLATNAMVRRVAAEYIEKPILAVFYSTKGTWPGVESFDWVGFDDYGQGANIFTNGQYASLKGVLRPDQRIMLIPGGAFGQRPEPFINTAFQDPQVILVMPFIWIDGWEGKPQNKGIRSVMPEAYRQAGLKIKG